MKSVKTDRGDCASACIAALLELPLSEVPFWFETIPDGADGAPAFKAMNEWLLTRGLWRFQVGFSDEQSLAELLPLVSQRSPDQYFIIQGRKGHVDHWCIARNGQIVMDPSPDNSGLHGPSHDGCWWVHTIVPSFMVRHD